jgi:uncharacterized protein (DUF1778 family)
MAKTLPKNKGTDPPKKRRKPASQRREQYLRVRLTDDQQDLIKAAAAHAGATISAWAVITLVREARREMGEERVTPTPKDQILK